MKLNTPPSTARNTKYIIIDDIKNKGINFSPPFMSPFCIIDSIIAEKNDIIANARTENILNSSSSTDTSPIEKDMLLLDIAGAIDADTSINIVSRLYANANSSGLIIITITPINIMNISVFAAISSFSVFVFLSEIIISSITLAISPPLSSSPSIKSRVLLMDGESYLFENSNKASVKLAPVITFFDTKPISSDSIPNSGFIDDHNDFSNDSPPLRFVDTSTK